MHDKVKFHVLAMISKVRRFLETDLRIPPKTMSNMIEEVT